MNRKHIRQWTAYAIRGVVSLALIGFLVSQLRQSAEGIAIASPWWLAFGLVLVPASVAIRVASFMLLVNRDHRVLSFPQAWYLTLLGAGANLFLPGGSGDLLKAAHGAREYGSPERVIASSIVDKLTSLASVAAMGVAGSFVAGHTRLAALSAVVLVVSAAPLVAPFVVPWKLVVGALAGKQADPERLATAVRTPPRLLVPVLGVSLLGWLATYTIVLACCRAAGVDVGASYVYSMAPLITLTGLMPISLAGLGLSQVTMSWILVSSGAVRSAAISAAFFQLLVNLTPGVVGIALYALRRRGGTGEGGPEGLDSPSET